MPRDYAQKKAPPRAKAAPASRIPRWVWLFTSGVVVLFVGGLFLLSQQPDNGDPVRFDMPSLSDMAPASTPSAGSNDQTATVEPAEEPPSLTRRAQLEFYTLLQQTDVLVPDEILALRQREVLSEPDTEAETPGGATTESPSASSSANESPGQFVIQVASFSNERDADNLRAKLILEGMTRAHVAAADLGDRGTFYRVMIGPVTSNRETQTIANRLDNMGLQGLVRSHTGD